MLDPRLISAVPLLGMLACTASYPDELGKPEELVIADDLDAASIPQPRAPREGASVASEDTVPRGNLIGSGSSTRGPGLSRFGATRVPTVRQAKAEVVGELDKDLIRRTVRAHINEVRRCYEKQIDRDPNARGRVAIAFEIDAKGKVQASTLQESTMKDPAAGECIAAAVKGWKFPKPRTGTVSVVYPFVLEPG